MTQPDQLGELQLAVLGVLWRQGECTVTEVHRALQDTRSVAPTTVATTLTGLERRGIVHHRAEGRRYVYRAVVDETTAKAQLVDELVDRVFRGDRSALLRHLLRDSDLDADRLQELRREIDQRRADAS